MNSKAGEPTRRFARSFQFSMAVVIVYGLGNGEGVLE